MVRALIAKYQKKRIEIEVINLTYGYSRDYKMDVPQLAHILICENQTGNSFEFHYQLITYIKK
ncbi:hypothetical protein SAMN02583745_00877 [Thorsellia anophelis DSM 18579]|uniref:Uncharacterized protein n=1 Tax=Thorsellia anophelis DSM 18579 TaxID=1123402 RepID=A0A1I0ABG7_9GAMM|nr:hypothetical protein SAMN02583745_00877 [Thorsellia anophelis DSM 18579]